MNCDSVLERIVAGETSSGNSIPAIEAHLKMCNECRIRVGAAHTLGRRLRDPILWEEPSADLAQVVVAAVAGDTVSRQSHQSWWIIGGVAAAAALVFGLGWLATRPDWSVNLVPGAAGPEATGVVSGWNVDEGTRMVIEISGIEKAPADSYYEVWMTAPDGRHVTAGSFRGPGKFEAMAGVRRGDFPRLWITLEPADDNPAPADATVLDTLRESASPAWEGADG